ncbi:MAG: DNA-3-methyladenine glycosylase [Deltaproteobacteria bacterium ADurb.Bin207]|jgi:3-methyladenine DNA glycosylase/8-oxoguanine DNA glycosylase|nr:MAG: DNA-3-methyladenine glycosylase [Deltaproteobacteria bacterium ADurb.Bin207]
MNSVMPSACTTQQPRAFDRATLELARRRLSRADPKIRTIIRGVGPCTLRTRPLGNHLTALVRSIVFQQLSGKAASTIFHRLLSLVPKRASASDYLRLSDESLRQAGLSRPKIVYLRDLCTKIDNRSLRLDRIGSRTDIEVEQDLVQVRGFGRWSAHMFLLFQLRRPDVWPVDDLGIRKALRLLDGLDSLPSAKTIAYRAEPWRPFRSVAAWYLWRSLETEVPADFG